MAFRIATERTADTVAYLRAREQVNGVYREAAVPLMLDGGEQVEGLAYLAERAHPSYAGCLPITKQAALIRAARGLSGTNLDYLNNTIAHLAVLGIRERELERVMVAAGPMFGRGAGEDQRRARSTGLVQTLRHEPIAAPRMSRGARKRFMHRQLVKEG